MPSLQRLASLFALGLFLLLPPGVQADDIQDINQLFRKGDLSAALVRANQFLTKNPKDAQVRFLKGLILADQGKSAEAIEVFTAITEDYPELPEPYNNLAVLYAAQGKYDAAKNALEMAIRTHPSYATAHENLGDLYAKMASQAYDKALQIDNSNKTAQTKLALIKDMMSGQAKRPAGTSSQAKQESKPVMAVATVTSSVPPAAKPVEAAENRTSVPTTAQNPSSAIETVQSWAKAWSSKNVDAYLAHYSPDFAPSRMSHSAWAAQRRERIDIPGTISVIARDIKVTRKSANRATVRFTQIYQSARLKNTSSKTLELELQNGKWLIISESGR